MAFDSPAPISRRTVAKGIAWTAPAVAIAGTAPAFAVSGPCTPEPVIDPNKSCKDANDKSYKLVFKIEGDNCAPGACSGTIEEIWENTGGPNAKLLWSEGMVADGTNAALICNTAADMSNYVVVKATIICGGDTINFYDKVAMPQWTSSNECQDDFCAE
ncbi:hypothetical protein [Tessaracoccus lapidicaptus]|uniref:hypothetical protein n=1 Tax=Tessaracoccus lapidicaptus TaxID=1427523 RepID=UPI00334077E0